MCNILVVSQSLGSPSSCNFAVAFAGGEKRQSESQARTELLALVRESGDEWLRLFRQPDVWSDPNKRRAMVRARLVYLDAAALYEEACSTK
jgi:hypothetical protein